jgi:anti-anti-sigma regulatory factor
MSEIGCGWDLHVERGPNWLLVRVHNAPDEPFEDELLAERLWHLMEEHCAYRMVLELDDVVELDSVQVRQLGLLRELARDRGGLVRLCGLSPRNWQVVVRNGLGDAFPRYHDRHEAVFAAHHPRKPR